MILALSRFRVKNGLGAQVRAAFEQRPRRVESTPGFLGLEVFCEAADPAAFVLLTRWSDAAAFRAWHASPEHDRSHALIPRGLKLDPQGTELIVADRIDGASSGGAEGELLADCSLSFATLLREGTSIPVVILGEGGRILRANRAFTGLLDLEVEGLPLASLLEEGSRAALDEALHAGADAGAGGYARFVRLQLHGRARRAGGRFLIEPLREGHALVGEVMLDEQQALLEQLQAMNADLAVLTRENARRTAELEAAHRELAAAHRALDAGHSAVAAAYHQLRDTHWHLQKIAEVLPMCVACRKVETGAEVWETVESYLARSSTFLSHGYCTSCAARVTAELDMDEEP